MVRYEFLSNCVVGTTLATWFLYELQPKEGSTWEFILVVGACLASGAAHGLIAFVVGLSLFGGDYGEYGFLSREQSFLARARGFLLVLVFEMVASGLMWGLASAFATAFAYGSFVKTAVYFFAPEIPAWLVAVGPPAGLAAGLLSIGLIKWATRGEKKSIWLLQSLRMVSYSNFCALARAKNAQSKRAKELAVADLRR